MKIAIGSDHAGFELKPAIIDYIQGLGYEVLDLGTDSRETVDYPDFGRAVGQIVAEKEADLGIVICGSGIGISISANKVKGIRCACVSDPYSARMSRRHNNANVLAFGARVVGIDVAKMLVDEFLNNDFEAGRHEKRVDKMMSIENN